MINNTKIGLIEPKLEADYTTLNGLANLIYDKLTDNEDQPQWQPTEGFTGAGVIVDTYGEDNPSIELYYEDRTIILELREEKVEAN